MTAILRSSKFKTDPNGNGGQRRSAQIQELVIQAGLEACDINLYSTNRIDRYVGGLIFLAKHKFNAYPSHRVISLCGKQSKIYYDNLNQHKGSKLLLWEDTENYIAPYVAKDFDFNILALPHNLESLVPDQRDPFTYQPLPDSFANEAKQLAKANAVFCIAREEQWLLKLYGIDADYLPYYPPQPILSNLLELRQLRQDTAPHRFLILGTAINPPTRIGMIEQIQWLSEISQGVNFTIDIIGYGTETLKDYCCDPRFTLHGTVDSGKLNHLLLNAKAVLAHQKAGVGALTRIPEMLIAGVPVIANANACRSAFSYPGVYCYDSRDELVAQMSRTLDTPSILERPADAETRFINCLKKLTLTSNVTHSLV
ncbi:glycosyltransferase [Stenomitos frigidus]|uniref:Glycosyltransferase n=1 Tax=Stenomitos frigidus ULC18 TaxID=2107698 RepID=A0A2T1ESI6_9CYAN|nr:glycosyltransferase [Stenomitos frigidus]PSB35720.1 hypothetical protein C7B82_00425 [Stenomitos frigidus ULC18]